MYFIFIKYFHNAYRHVDINDTVFAMSAFLLVKLDQRHQSRKSCDVGAQRLEFLTQVCTYYPCHLKQVTYLLWALVPSFVKLRFGLNDFVHLQDSIGYL